MNNSSIELLEFFKALADSNRLKIIGFLARQSYTVEQLADLLVLSPSTTSHHLSRLSKAGLVEAHPDGHYYRYSLRTEVLQEMSQRILNTDNLPKPSPEKEIQDPYDRKVLDAFIDSNGRIKTFPSQEKKFLVLLRYISQAFEVGKRYSEKEVNAILSRYNDDTAALRRGLVEFKIMDRQGGGGDYWLRE